MNINYKQIGNESFWHATNLFPICRSITGRGVRETLNYLNKYIPELKIKSVKSGKKVFDWTVPEEWNIQNAFICDFKGNKVVKFSDSNLHVVGYSCPINKFVTGSELVKHLHSIPERPKAIPYITSYYKKRWGFCVTHEFKLSIKKEDIYHVFIDSSFHKGCLNYGEVFIPATSLTKKEIFLSTYICHPSMANNELSGPVVTMALIKWIKSLPSRNYNYRIVFVPETIGSIAYLSKNFKRLKRNVKAGFNITCVGDDRVYSFMPSRNSSTISDKAARTILKCLSPDYKVYNWNDRGSDERQYCSPGIDLPIATIMRSKYGEYPEYHTSDDKLGIVVTPDGLAGGFKALQLTIEAIERNCFLKATNYCEPQLSPRGLYPDISVRDGHKQVLSIMNILTYSDGKHDLLDIAELISIPVWELYPLIEKLIEAKLIKKIKFRFYKSI